MTMTDTHDPIDATGRFPEDEAVRPDPSRSTPGAPGRKTGRERAALAVKTLVSLGLLGFLFAQADWAVIGARLAEASLPLLLAGFAIKTLTIPFAAERWRAVAAAAGVVFGHVTSIKLMMVSLLFGQALPGALGGDLVRGWLTWRLGHSPSAVMMALLVDRLAALAGVIVVLIAGAPHLLAVAPPEIGWSLAIAAVTAPLGLAAILWLDRLPLPAFLSRRTVVAGLLTAAARMRRALTPAAGGLALLHSVAVHLSTVVAAFIFTQALGLRVSFLDCLAVVPLAIVAAALPISLAGWGVREGSMVAGFALFGVAAGDALLVSLLIGLSVLLMASPGAIVWLVWRGGDRPAQLPAQLPTQSPAQSPAQSLTDDRSP